MRAQARLYGAPRTFRQSCRCVQGDRHVSYASARNGRVQVLPSAETRMEMGPRGSKDHLAWLRAIWGVFGFAWDAAPQGRCSEGTNGF